MCYFIYLRSSLNWCILFPHTSLDQKCLESFKCGAGEGFRRSIGPIIWKMRKCEKRDKKERNFLHTRRKANWTGHILRRNCLLKHVTEWQVEGRLEMTGSRGRRGKQLLDDLKEKRRYRKLKGKALDRTLWRARFGRGYVPVVRQTTE